MLDRNVFEVMVFCVGCRFNFDQPPASVSTALENIHPDENVAVLKRALEYRRNFWIVD
jgi:hypothetical protein